MQMQRVHEHYKKQNAEPGNLKDAKAETLIDCNSLCALGIAKDDEEIFRAAELGGVMTWTSCDDQSSWPE
jgi:hypothetical protein